MPLMLVIGTINRYPPPGAGWDVVHVDASARGIWDPDLSRNIPVDVVADMRSLPFADAGAQRIQCWHALEHVNRQGGRDAISEFRRVLCPGGLLDIRVPDLAYVSGAASIEDVLALIYGDQVAMPDSELNVHRWGYTLPSLRRLLTEHGFSSGQVAAQYPDEIHLHAIRGS